jgi:hypothetical protein
LFRPRGARFFNLEHEPPDILERLLLDDHELRDAIEKIQTAFEIEE